MARKLELHPHRDRISSLNPLHPSLHRLPLHESRLSSVILQGHRAIAPVNTGHGPQLSSSLAHAIVALRSHRILTIECSDMSTSGPCSYTGAPAYDALMDSERHLNWHIQGLPHDSVSFGASACNAHTRWLTDQAFLNPQSWPHMPHEKGSPKDFRPQYPGLYTVELIELEE